MIVLFVLVYLLLGVMVVALIESASDHIIESESGPTMVGIAAVLWPATVGVVVLILLGWLIRKASDVLDRSRS